MRAVLIAIQLVACCLAWWRVRSEPEHRPAAWMLTAMAVADALRFPLAALLAHPPRPYTGLWRVLFHTDQALMLVWPTAPVAAGLVLFLGLRAWPPIAAAILAWMAMVCSYPMLRGEPLITTYRVLTLLGSMAYFSAMIIGFGAGYVRRPARRHLALMVVSGGDLLLWSTTWSSNTHRDWSYAVAANLFMFALLAAIHLPSRWSDADERVES